MKRQPPQMKMPDEFHVGPVTVPAVYVKILGVVVTWAIIAGLAKLVEFIF